MLEEVAQRSRGCSIVGSTQNQVGWDLEQTAQCSLKDVPAHSRKSCLNMTRSCLNNPYNPNHLMVPCLQVVPMLFNILRGGNFRLLTYDCIFKSPSKKRMFNWSTFDVEIWCYCRQELWKVWKKKDLE